jgi:predicted glutamine amidotransferase
VRELWGRYWVFAHNGDLKDFRPRLHSHFRPVARGRRTMRTSRCPSLT